MNVLKNWVLLRRAVESDKVVGVRNLHIYLGVGLIAATVSLGAHPSSLYIWVIGLVTALLLLIVGVAWMLMALNNVRFINDYSLAVVGLLLYMSGASMGEQIDPSLWQVVQFFAITITAYCMLGLALTHGLRYLNASRGIVVAPARLGSRCPPGESRAYLYDINHLTLGFSLFPIYPVDEAALRVPNFIGGNPWLPDDLQWPRDEDGVPLHFFAQIDLATLDRPPIDTTDIVDLPDFPSNGMLYFFLRVDNEWTDHGEIYDSEGEALCRVIYSPSIPKHRASALLPGGLRPLCPSLLEIGGPWYLYRDELADIQARPSLTLPRVPLTPRWSLSSRTGLKLTRTLAGSPLSEIKHRWLTYLRQDQLDDQIDARVPWVGWDRRHPPSPCAGFPALRWCWLSGIEDEDEFRHDSRVVDVPAKFPWHWIQVERMAFAMIYQLSLLESRDGAVYAELSPCRAEAEQWIACSRKQLLFAEVNQAARLKFQQWLQQLANRREKEPTEVITAFRRLYPADETDDDKVVWQHRYHIRYFMKDLLKMGFYMSWPYCVASGQLGMVPPAFIDAMKTGHIQDDLASFHVHQLFCETEEVYQIDDPGEKAWVPLLQIASDRGADMQWGSSFGAISFWIDPKALAEKDFSGVVARFHM